MLHSVLLYSILVKALTLPHGTYSHVISIPLRLVLQWLPIINDDDLVGCQ